MTEFEQIYRAYFQDVELYLRAISHNESLAEELTEQVFFQALNALPKFRGDCDVRTWLCSMARNAYLSHLRKERPSQPIDELEMRPKAGGGGTDHGRSAGHGRSPGASRPAGTL